MSSWVHARSLFEFDPENPRLDDEKYVLTPKKYRHAIKAYAKAMGFESYEALKEHNKKIANGKLALTYLVSITRTPLLVVIFGFPFSACSRTKRYRQNRCP